MKFKNILLSFLTLSILVFGCKKSDDPSPEEQQTKKLTKTWTITSVTLSPSTDYSYNSTVTYTFGSDKTFTATNAEALPFAASPFREMPTSGTWAFEEGSNFEKVVLTDASNDKVTLTIMALDDNNLTVTYPGAEPKETNLVTVTVKATSAQ